MRTAVPNRMLRLMAFRVIIAGGGVAGIESALALHALAPELVSIQLVSPKPEFAYRPLVVSEPFGHGHVQMVDLHAIARDTGAELRIAGLDSATPGGQRFHTWIGAVSETGRNECIAIGGMCTRSPWRISRVSPSISIRPRPDVT